MLARTLSTAVLSVLLLAPAHASDLAAGSFGIALGVPTQDPGLFVEEASGGGIISGVYFVDDDNALRAHVGFDFFLQPEVDLMLSLGAGYRMYQAPVDRVVPFLEPGVSISGLTDDESLTLLGAFHVGAEFFFTPQLTLSGAIGARLIIIPDDDVITVGLATAPVHLNVYW